VADNGAVGALTIEQRRHEAACERAGCRHPVFYFFTEGVVFGWCWRCRTVELGPENALGVELGFLHGDCCKATGCDHAPYRPHHRGLERAHHRARVRRG
jgi:hypothetical protein